MINIADMNVVALDETVDVVIDVDGELYRFEVTVHDREGSRTVGDVHYLGRYEKPLKNSVKKAIRKMINDQLK